MNNQIINRIAFVTRNICIVKQGIVVALCIIAMTGCKLLSVEESWHYKITIKAVDDDAQPVSDMHIGIGDEYGHHSKGNTDKNGLYVATGVAWVNKIAWGLDKEGYYGSYGIYSSPVDKTTKKMLPWNPVVTTIVRRVINPIPMQAKLVEPVKVTKLPESFGYDLLVGDWVAPRGTGVVNDITFKADGYLKDWTDYHAVLSLTFLHDTDGVAPFIFPQKPSECVSVPMGSSLIIPHRAPESGYVSHHELNVSYTPSPDPYAHPARINECEGPVVFRFRIRSSTNESGSVTNAYYGQFRNIKFFPPGLRYPKGEPRDGGLGFTYYLNPTPNDKNLEFDPQQTLRREGAMSGSP